MTATAAPAYDTLEGIREAVKTLEGLNELVKERREAGYKRDERLHEFVVMGQWYLDPCGNCGKLDKRHDIPSVVTQDEFNSLTGGSSYSVSYSSQLPPANVVCPVCKRGWMIEDSYDVVVRDSREDIPLDDKFGGYVGKTLLEVQEYFSLRRDGVFFMQEDITMKNDKYIDNEIPPEYKAMPKNGGGYCSISKREYMPHITWEHVVEEVDVGCFNVWRYYHRACNDIEIAVQMQERFRKLFEDAGYGTVLLTPIPNGYCSCEMCAPWFKVKTAYGEITLGWRKRVINIDCPSSVPIGNLFAQENVTKGEGYIHAWGYDKAQEYLTVIRGALASR